MSKLPASMLHLWLLPLALVFLSAPTEAAALPDWAEEIAASAPEVAVEVRDDQWRTLLFEITTRIDEEGRLEIVERRAKQALSGRVETAVDSSLMSERREIDRARAWHLAPGEGRAKRARRSDSFELGGGEAFMTDQMQRAIVIEELERGSLVFFEFVVEEEPLSYDFMHVLPTGEELAQARIRYTLPDGWSLRSRWLGAGGPEPTKSARTWSWELADLPRIEYEPLGDPLVARMPRLLVSLSPPSGGRTAGVTLESWPAMSAWYDELIAPQHAVTPQLSAQASELESAAGDGFVEKVASANAFVRDSVRYVAEAIGIGALKPRAAAEVLETRWGDCKDKATLLAVLLAEKGIASHPVLVHLSAPDTVDEELPAIGSFNHVILAIAVPKDALLPSFFEGALAEVEGHGQLLFTDPTDEYTALGSLPGALAGRRGLLVDGEGGQLVTLPGYEPRHHRLEVEVVAEREAAGGYAFTMSTRRHGQLATRARAAYRASSKDNELAQRELVSEGWPGAELGAYEVVAEDEEGAFVDRISWRLAGTSGQALALFPDPSNWLPSLSLRDRASDVVYGYPREILYRARVLGAPPDTTLQGAYERAIEGLALSSSMKRKGDAIEAEGRIVLSETRFGPERFRDLRRAWAGLRALRGAELRLP